jgi:hypothetical protein
MIPRIGGVFSGRDAGFASLSIRVASIPALALGAIPRNAVRIPGAHSPWDIFRIRVLTFLVRGHLH